MDRSTPSPADVVRALFTERGRQWESHDALISAVERALDRLLSEGRLDAITLCHCPPGATQMVVESGYQPGPNLHPLQRTAVA